ncbi:MAG: sigma-54-dependent transcriptional regulator [Pyrinomonadaceae bacterium]
MAHTLYALVIDDDAQVSGLVARALEIDGWHVSEAASAEEALERLNERSWSLVFSDVVLGGMDGYEVLRQFSDQKPDARFVLMTGHGSAAGALDATSIGAHDYLVKPFSILDVTAISSAVREQQQHHDEDNRKSAKDNRKTEDAGYKSDLPLIGKSARFVECLKMVGRIAATDLPVLITGESGTGKEVVARAIHQRSRRVTGQFVTVNCGAIPNELIESELFGHAKGAFTGADRERVGLWEVATGGTLLLDEITETSPLFQVKLLRALQEGEIRRVGSNRTIKVDVRVLAATNRDIEVQVAENRFRQDLMYRLNAVTIELPPLRERLEDIRPLAEHFAAQVQLAGTKPVRFSQSAIEKLKAYSWPGNIRELENAVLHAVSLSDGLIYPDHLPIRIRDFDPHSVDSFDGDDAGPATQAGTKWLSLSELEKQYVTRVLAHTEGNKQAASRILNIDRKTLARIISREVDNQ